MNEVMQIESVVCTTPSVTQSSTTVEETTSSPAGPVVFTVTSSSNVSQNNAPVLKLVSPVEGGTPQLIKVVPTVVSPASGAGGQTISTEAKVMVQKVDDSQSDVSNVVSQRVYSIVTSGQKIGQVQGGITANLVNQNITSGSKSFFNNGQQRVHTLSNNARFIPATSTSVSTTQKVQILNNVVVGKQNIVINKNSVQASRQVVTIPQKQINNNIQKSPTQSQSVAKLQTVNNIILTTNSVKNMKSPNVTRSLVQSSPKTIKTLTPQQSAANVMQKSTGIKTIPPQINHYNKIQQSQMNKVITGQLNLPRVGIKTLTPQRPLSNNNSRPNSISTKPNYIGKHASQAQKTQSKVNISGMKNKNLVSHKANPSLNPVKNNNNNNAQKLGAGNTSSNFNQILTAQILQSLPSSGNKNITDSGLSSNKNYLLQSPIDESSLSEDFGDEVNTEYSPKLLYQIVMLDHNYGAPPPAISPPSIVSRTIQHQSPGTGNSNLNGSSLTNARENRDSNTNNQSNYFTATSPIKRGQSRLSTHQVPINSSLISSETKVNMNSSLMAAEPDDDITSTISSEREHFDDGDEGEETETAPENEGDEDGITRCICDFDHDDGYMICCDVCSSWQHVDCMGLDREDIPEKYSCVRCQPRRVDRQHARAIQQRKREEFARIGTLAIGSGSATSGTLAGEDGSGNLSDSSSDTSTAESTDGQSHQGGRHSLNNNLVGGKKRSNPPATRRKSEPTLSHGRRAPLPHKRQQRRESMREINSSIGRRSSTLKKRDKKQNLKRKFKSRSSIDDSSQDSWPSNAYNTTTNITQLRQWIENYEEAVTNHYSPELRARITNMRANGVHSNTDNQFNQDKQAPPTAQADVTTKKCRISTLPLNGTKIVLATQSLPSNSPVIELRGKYMLSTQHRFSGSGSGSGSGSSGLLTRQHSQKPGPFLFFYRLPKDGTEVCVDTRTYGNDARFIRRSCKPNAELRHLIEKGTLHLYVITTIAVDKNSELTIRHESHDLAAVAAASNPLSVNVTCACGNPNTCGLFNSHHKNGTQDSSAKENVDTSTSYRKRRGRRSSPPRTDLSPSESSLTSPTAPNYSSSIQENPGVSETDTKASGEKNMSTPPALSTRRQSSHQNKITGREKSSEREKSKEKEVVKTEVKDKKKKLTREERKMEAIMKAFEKLEKAQQRKQEVQARQAQRRESDNPPTTSQNNSRQENEESERDASRLRRKKRKGRTRSTHTNSQSSTRRRTRINSTDSYITSGEDSSLLSPPIPQNTSTSNQNTDQRHTRSMTLESKNEKATFSENKVLEESTYNEKSNLDSETNEISSPGQVNTAAGLLLALANGGNLSSEEQNLSKSIDNDGNSSGSNSSLQSSPGTPLSSACLLVAAAVGPLEPGFKFPKTKKAIMNEWLNKSPEPSQSSVISPMTIMPTNLDLSTDICMPQTTNTTQQPEYFINSNSNKSLATLVQAANLCDSPPQSFSGKHNLTGSGQNSGNAKKRWLRQAISEECDSPNSRPESPPGNAEVIAPLKKRRLARESLSSEQSYTPPTTPTLLVPPTNSLTDEDYPNNDEEFYNEDCKTSLISSSQISEESGKIHRLDISFSGSNFPNSASSYHQELDCESIAEQIEFTVGNLTNKRDANNLINLSSNILDPRLGRNTAPIFKNSAQLVGTLESKIRQFEEQLTGPLVPQTKMTSTTDTHETSNQFTTTKESEISLSSQVEQKFSPIENSIKKDIKKSEIVTPAKRKLSISEYRQRKQLKVPEKTATDVTTPERTNSPEISQPPVCTSLISSSLHSTTIKTSPLPTSIETTQSIKPCPRSRTTSNSSTSSLTSDEELMACRINLIGTTGLELTKTETSKISTVIEPQIAVAFNSAPTAVERRREEKIEYFRSRVRVNEDSRINNVVTKDIQLSPKLLFNPSSEYSKSLEITNSKFSSSSLDSFSSLLTGRKLTTTSVKANTDDDLSELQEKEKKEDTLPKLDDTVLTNFIPPFNNPVYPNSTQFTSFSTVLESSSYEGRNPSPPAELLKSATLSSYPNTSLTMSPSTTYK